jgi:hypothetical protein
MTLQAWDFEQALEASRRGKLGQEAAERDRKDAVEVAAKAERAYRSALAAEIVRTHAQGAAWTVAQDLARGEKHVADLRYERDVAVGMKEIAEQRAWRHQSDRRDIREFVQWSRIIAPLGDQPEPRNLAPPIGRRAA